MTGYREDLSVSLALKRTLEVARFVWVLAFLNLLRVCCNKIVPVFFTSSISLCGRVNFLHFKILAVSIPPFTRSTLPKVPKSTV